MALSVDLDHECAVFVALAVWPEYGDPLNKRTATVRNSDGQKG